MIFEQKWPYIQEIMHLVIHTITVLFTCKIDVFVLRAEFLLFAFCINKCKRVKNARIRSSRTVKCPIMNDPQMLLQSRNYSECSERGNI